MTKATGQTTMFMTKATGQTVVKLAPTLLALSALGVAYGGAASLNERGQTATTKSEPSRQPILRVETGMHTAPIRRIGVDAAGRYLVTSSDDKTVRLWELATGRLLRVLRPPIGAGNEGKIFAVAISPDSRLIAAGGWTGYEWDKQHSIYLFDRVSERMALRLGGLPNVVDHLAFSPDGSGLAATLGADGGIRVFRVADGTEIGRDTDYGADSYNLDFDRAGRLVTSCFDGYLRLYDRNLKLIKKVRATGGQQPYGVRFSPDGMKVAVGYLDSTRVDVLDAGSMESLYQPDGAGVSKGSLNSVAWSVDGAALYAGGKWDDGTGINPIRRWADAGRGRYLDLAAAKGSIFGLAPLPDGGVVFGAADPVWGVFSASGHLARLVAGEIADYRSNQEILLTDAAGAIVSFAYEPSGKSPARFSALERRLETKAGAGAPLQPPRTNGIAVTDWRDNYAPILNGVKLALEPNEMSRCLAVTPDTQSFLLGTEFNLRHFDRNGKELWRAAIPGVAWNVNISGNSKLAIAEFGDGTIRWYRMSDGKELLAFFPHIDRSRWVAWTPGGYYDCSPGAEDLIGWHINNGKNQTADFFPAGKFRGVYYRPDIVSRALATGDEAQALRLANEEAGRILREADLLKRLPPVVSIISPADGAEISSATVSVRYTVRAPSGEPVTAVQARVDGQRVNVARGQGATQAAGQSLQVTIPERDCELALIAENQYAASVPAVVQLRWRGRVTLEGFVIKPKLYVLAIGVSRYANPQVRGLQFADDDARDFAAAMVAQKGKLYRDVISRVLTDEQATKEGVLDGFEWILKETTQHDVAMILLAGHGDNDNYGDYFFCPYNIDPARTLRTGVPFSDIKKTVERLAGKALFFVDTCRSGNALGTGSGKRSPDIVGLVNELASAENGAVVFAASTGRQLSFERSEWGHGAFTKAVIEGFNGGADLKRTGKITVNMLDVYISERVKELTGGQQTPTTTKPKTVPDFPIAVRP